MGLEDGDMYAQQLQACMVICMNEQALYATLRIVMIGYPSSVWYCKINGMANFVCSLAPCAGVTDPRRNG